MVIGLNGTYIIHIECDFRITIMVVYFFLSTLYVWKRDSVSKIQVPFRY